MTAIAGLVHDGRVYLGGDSLALRGWDRIPLATPKVHRSGPYLIGVAGSLRSLQIIRYAFHPPRLLDLPDVDVVQHMAGIFVFDLRAALKEGGYATTQNDQEFNTDSLVIVGVRGRLFTIDSTYAVTESTRPYAAIGSGEDMALGALYATDGLPPKHRIRTALAAAAEFNAGVGGPTTILSMRNGASR